MDQQVTPMQTNTPQKRRLSAAQLLDSDSDDNENEQEALETVNQETISVRPCTVSLDSAISYWEDPGSPQFFVSVVLFLPSGVPSASLKASVPPSKNRLNYSYERPLPARDAERLCRRWTTNADITARLEPYHPFVTGFHQYFKRFRARDDEIIISQGSVLFDEGITVEESIHELFCLKFSDESTNAVLITLRQTNIDSYKQSKEEIHELEA